MTESELFHSLAVQFPNFLFALLLAGALWMIVRKLLDVLQATYDDLRKLVVLQDNVAEILQVLRSAQERDKL